MPWYFAGSMQAARVLLMLDASAAWSRGILRGFSAVAHEQGWNLLHYQPARTSLEWLARVWRPAAVVLGPEVGDAWPSSLRGGIVISVNADRTADGVASICLNESRIATEAMEHLRSTGLTHLTTFRYDESPFAIERERAFRRAAAEAGACVAVGWGMEGDKPSPAHEDPAAMAAWLGGLPKPCGVFAGCDAWATVVARYARAAELRVPEDVAIVGVDNDAIACELCVPPLSSVTVPWQSVGRQAAQLVRVALSGRALAVARVVVDPGHVMTRRSSDALAIEDLLVARAVRWIHEHSLRAVTVPMVARAVATSRRRLERRFHAVLGRTVVEEVRRARVETAKRLLSTTRYGLTDVAKNSGFTSAALLNVAFRREVGLPPGAYRRRVRATARDDD